MEYDKPKDAEYGMKDGALRVILCEDCGRYVGVSSDRIVRHNLRPMLKCSGSGADARLLAMQYVEHRIKLANDRVKSAEREVQEASQRLSERIESFRRWVIQKEELLGMGGDRE